MKFWPRTLASLMKSVEKDTDRDNYMTAEEAKAYGLIDGVVEQ